MNFTPCDQLTVGINVFPQEDECLGAMNSVMKNCNLFADNLWIDMYKIQWLNYLEWVTWTALG